MNVGHVLVTGAHGFIGAAVAAHLSAQGATVVRAGRTARRAGDVAFDIHDCRATGDALRALQPATLVHAAWITDHGRFWDSAENERWVDSSTELVRAFVRNGGRRFAGIGSCAEYAWDGTPLVEDVSPLRPQSRYGRAKAAFAAQAAALLAESGAEFAWARVFHVYGNGEDPRKFLSAALAASRRGEPLRARDPGRRLDFVHVDDVARAVAALATGPLAGACNVGTGCGVQVSAALAEIERALGRSGDAPAAAAGIEPDVVADVTRAKRELGWSAEISLAAGICGLVNGSMPRGTPT